MSKDISFKMECLYFFANKANTGFANNESEAFQEAQSGNFEIRLTFDSQHWEQTRLDTRGTGNLGFLFVLPKTAEARRAMKVGRVVAEMHDENDYDRALRMVNARKGIRHSQESEVKALTQKLVDEYSYEYLETIKPWGKGSFDSWTEAHSLPPRGNMSAWRYLAAFEVAKKFLAS